MQTLYFIVYNFFNCSSFFVKVFSLLSSFLLLFISFFLSIPYSISPLETKPCSYVLHDSPSAALIQFTGAWLIWWICVLRFRLSCRNGCRAKSGPFAKWSFSKRAFCKTAALPEFHLMDRCAGWPCQWKAGSGCLHFPTYVGENIAPH